MQLDVVHTEMEGVHRVINFTFGYEIAEGDWPDLATPQIANALTNTHLP